MSKEWKISYWHKAQKLILHLDRGHAQDHQRVKKSAGHNRRTGLFWNNRRPPTYKGNFIERRRYLSST